MEVDIVTLPLKSGWIKKENEMRELTAFGKAVKQLLIEVNANVCDLVDYMGVSRAIVSAMLHGAVKVPQLRAVQAQEFFRSKGLTGGSIDNLTRLAEISNGSISVEGLSAEKLKLILGVLDHSGEIPGETVDIMLNELKLIRLQESVDDTGGFAE